MKIFLIAIGQQLPAWINEGFNEYSRRLPHECSLELIEVAAAKRFKNRPVQQQMVDEGERQLNAVPKNCRLIALDERGALWDTQTLVQHLQNWQQQGQNIALLVGGADGLAENCKKAAKEHWSLSRLTLPHGLVRIIIAEQLYRAWSIQQNHPYHRT
jgi:23S rRNA (pseudouridine1915-N3)-methyltransferase